jgi:hypothetical protein
MWWRRRGLDGLCVSLGVLRVYNEALETSRQGVFREGGYRDRRPEKPKIRKEPGS